MLLAVIGWGSPREPGCSPVVLAMSLARARPIVLRAMPMIWGYRLDAKACRTSLSRRKASSPALVQKIGVVMISVVGTLVTDNLVDNFGVALETTTIVFSVALAATFAVWYAVERTLSIHTIYTTRREIFYWLAILFTFALGTSAGDWVAEGFGLGYLVAGLIFAAVIAAIAIADYRFQLDGILAFWLAYILTRPLGASLGDLFSQPAEYGGLASAPPSTASSFSRSSRRRSST